MDERAASTTVQHVVVEPTWAPGRIFLTGTRRHVAFAAIVALSAEK